MIVALTGLAGSGKSTVADELRVARGFAVVSLADPIKRVCQELFGWSRETLWGPSELRNVPDPAWGGLTPRHALQQLGTEWGRAMHPDVWVRAVLRSTQDHANVVIPDVRFLNEADAVHCAGGVVWRIVRPGLVPGDHPSESEQWRIRPDWTIENRGSVAELQSKALEALDLCWC